MNNKQAFALSRATMGLMYCAVDLAECGLIETPTVQADLEKIDQSRLKFSFLTANGDAFVQAEQARFNEVVDAYNHYSLLVSGLTIE